MSRRLYHLIMVFLVLAIVASAVNIFYTVQAQVPRAPITYTQSEFSPTNSPICAGEVLVIKAEGIGIGGDEVVVVVDSFFGPNGYMDGFDQFTFLAVPPNDTAGQVQSITIEVEIPEEFPPGDYLVVHGNSTFPSRSDTFRSEFTIINCN